MGLQVTFITSELAHNDTQLIPLIQRLRERDWDAQLVTVTISNKDTSLLQSTGIPHTSLDEYHNISDPRLFYALVKLLRTLNTDVVVGCTYSTNLLTRLVAKWISVRAISSFRHYKKGFIYDKTIRLTDSVAKISTANSVATANALISHGVVPEGRLRVIPDGISLEKLSRQNENRLALRTELQIAPDWFVWLTTGVFTGKTDCERLMKAFAEHVQKNQATNCLLLFAGPKFLYTYINAIANLLGIAAQVQTISQDMNLFQALPAADAVVVASENEHLITSVMGASAAGVPVVATNAACFSEVIVDQCSGLLYPAANQEMLVASLDRIYKFSVAERKRMGMHGQAQISANYELDRVAMLWENLFCEIMELENLEPMEESMPS